MIEETSLPVGMDPGLTGSGAIVFGVGPGIGLECARLLCGLGADVACVDIDPGRADAAAGELAGLPGRATALACDVIRPDSVRDTVARAVDSFGRLDVAINVVGHGGPPGRVVDITDDVWTDVMRINLDHQFVVARELLRPMIANRRGSMVFISSVNALSASPMRAVYGAAKAGLVSLAKTLAIEVAEYGVRVNTVAPGPTRTPRRQHLAEGELSGVYRDAIPLGRLAEPYEIARAATFLASDLAAYITGETLVIDGGATVKYPLPAGN